MAQFQIQGIKQLNKKLNKAIKKLGKMREEVLRPIAFQGMQHIWAIAPQATGALKRAVKLEFPQRNEVWIISGQPQKTFYNQPFNPVKTTQPLPYHYYIEGVEGYPFQPAKTGVNAYMEKTAEQLKQKIDQKLVEVSNVIFK